MDGEHGTSYADGAYHARSIDSAYHESRTYAARTAAMIGPRLGALVGPNAVVEYENMYARHTVPYTDLEDYTLVISIWDGDRCLAWPDTVGIAEVLGLSTVPLITTVGPTDEPIERVLERVLERVFPPHPDEGLVVRNPNEFMAEDFQSNVAKWVRPDFLPPDTEHWFRQRITRNGMRRA